MKANTNTDPQTIFIVDKTTIKSVIKNLLHDFFQFDLGCQNWKRTLIGTIHNSGLFLSLPLTGIISDRYGRKKALAIASTMNCIFGVIRSFSPNYIMMVACEFLEAGFGAGAYSTAFVLGKLFKFQFNTMSANFIANFIM